jgi:hypothetical protein
MRRAFLAMLLLASGCMPDQGPAMDPGQNCLRCHGGVPAGSSQGSHNARAWSFAGTVYPSVDSPLNAGIEGATVAVTDADGRSLSVRSNLVGNFYSAESMTPPLQACVEYGGVTRCMTQAAPHGACNYCHALPPISEAPGRLVGGGTQDVP